MRRALAPLSIMLLVTLLAACGDPPPPPAPPPKTGRAETQGIRNTDAIGVHGSAIADKVDSALNANDQQRKKMEEAQQQQTDPNQ